jgi:NitT/TauT family transport system substrate-binding protein
MKTIIRICALLLLAMAVLAACRPQEVEKPPDEVSVQLKFVHQAQFAGFYVAQERGYYADENIEVTFIEGGPGIEAAEQVITGQADFGVDAPEDVLMQRSQGKPVVAIAVIYRRNPLVFVALADSGIERPSDFLGRTVAIAACDGELQLEAMLKRLGLDINQVEIIPFSYDYDSFYNGEVDVTIGYATGGLIRIRQQGYQVNVIWPSDYVVHLYADTLITTDEMIAENPDLVTRLLRATLRGWREAIEDPEAAVEITLKYAREADAELQTQMMEASVPLVHTGEDQIGWMRGEVWQGMHDILLEQGLLDEPLDMDEVYTMEFLQKVYGGE